MEDNLNFLVDGRRPPFFIYRRQPQFLLLMEDDLKFGCKWKIISICFKMTGIFLKGTVLSAEISKSKTYCLVLHKM
jgi:hypothetical protein